MGRADTKAQQLTIEGQHPCCWAPSKALKELERGMNNSPCILTDAPAEINDTPLYRDPAGIIAAQQRILNRLAEMLGVNAGDGGGLVEAVERLKRIESGSAKTQDLGKEAIKSLEATSRPVSNSRDWGTVPYACDWVRADRHNGRGGWK